VEARAREAAENVAGQVQGTRCVVKNGVIDFSQQGEREKLQSAFSNLWAELSRNREQWPRQMQDFVARASQEDATGYEQSAALLVCGLLQTDVVCRGACEYPDDRKLTEWPCTSWRRTWPQSITFSRGSRHKVTLSTSHHLLCI
jgi:hypothetical protein